MKQGTAEISRAPPMRHHGYKMARRVSDTYEMCNCSFLFCNTNVLIYRNIRFSKIYLHMLKLQQVQVILDFPSYTKVLLFGSMLPNLKGH